MGVRVIFLAFLVLLFFNSNAKESEKANTLIAVTYVKINSKNESISKEFSNEGHDNYFTLRNTSTGEFYRIHDPASEKVHYLPPGFYCFGSIRYLFNNLKGTVYGDICFEVYAEGITNAGKWVIGMRDHAASFYGLIVDVPGNFEEVAHTLNISNYRETRYIRKP